MEDIRPPKPSTRWPAVAEAIAGRLAKVVAATVDEQLPYGEMARDLAERIASGAACDEHLLRSIELNGFALTDYVEPEVDWYGWYGRDWKHLLQKFQEIAVQEVGIATGLWLRHHSDADAVMELTAGELWQHFPTAWKALLPFKEWAPYTPARALQVADWYEEQGRGDVALWLRELVRKDVTQPV